MHVTMWRHFRALLICTLCLCASQSVVPGLQVMINKCWCVFFAS